MLDHECNTQLKPSPRKIRRVFLDGEETRRTHVNTHVNHSAAERGGERRTREREREREKKREREGVADKWPSRQTRDRAEVSGQGQWHVKVRTAVGLAARARGLAVARNGRGRGGRTREKELRVARPAPLCVHSRRSSLPLLVLSPKQRLESNLRACHVVAMAPRCTSVGALSVSNEHGTLI